MRISVLGLGYVGAVSAACLAEAGHDVVGVDISAAKVDLINNGRAPIIEPGLSEMITSNVSKGRIRATTDARDGIGNTELSFICVGTPSRANGDLDTGAVEAVCREIGETIREKPTRHTVVMRSTILPGTMHDVVIPVLEQTTGGVAGQDFGLAHNPEFLREGTAVRDFHAPPKTVIGVMDDETAAQLSAIYQDLEAPLIVTSLATSEMVKYADNAWHALKVCFANEIGNICKAQSIDSHAVMDIFCQDTKLNLSPYYLRPGFAFGGSCLPKDTRALNYRARSLDLDLPILSNILASNRMQVERAVDLVIAKGKRRISILGFSFKAGTDDLRESPQVELIERCWARAMTSACLTGTCRWRP
jgi:GDP-mannose 6-dehydrogenase